MSQLLGIDLGTSGVKVLVTDPFGKVPVNGLIEPMPGSISVSSGGTIVVPLLAPHTDPLFRLHTLCHAPADH